MSDLSWFRPMPPFNNVCEVCGGGYARACVAPAAWLCLTCSTLDATALNTALRSKGIDPMSRLPGLPPHDHGA